MSDWQQFKDLVPIVVAVISLVGVIIGITITWRGNRQKLALERELAQQRLTADREIADLKAQLDVQALGRRIEIEGREATARRNADLAEAALMNFHRARDIIAAARSVNVGSSEGNSRARLEGETEEISRTLNSYYATVERLAAHDQLFADLEQHRLRFLTLFGDAAAEPFEELRRIRNRLHSAVHMLMMTARHGDRAPQAHTWEDIIWSHGETDEIGDAVSKAVANMDAICRPLIDRPPRR